MGIVKGNMVLVGDSWYSVYFVDEHCVVAYDDEGEEFVFDHDEIDLVK